MSDAEEKSFYRNMQDIANKSFTGMCVALGSSLGIFDIMCTFKTPQRYEVIAEKGNWKPRYIKEWLNGMVLADVIEYNKQDDTYFIPENHRPFLSGSGGATTFVKICDALPVISSVYSELSSVVDKEGPDGISYSHYAGLHEWLNETADSFVSWKSLHSAFTQVPELLQKLENGGSICDGGCSAGYLSLLIAENLPNSTVVGIDISQHAIEMARDKAKSKGASNITFEVIDACDLPKEWEGKFDMFTAINVVHELPFPEKFLKGTQAALKPGGVIIMAEVFLHSNVADSKKISYAPWVHGMSLFHCVPVSMNVEGGAGLGATWGIEKQKAMLESAGFTGVKVLQCGPGGMAYHVGYKA